MLRAVPFLAVAVGLTTAHTIMQAVGNHPQGFGIYMPSDDSFIADLTSDSLACNGPPVTSFTSSSGVIEVNAGDTVTGAWLHTLTSTGADSSADNKVIDSSHKGPVLAYLKKVDDATKNPSAGPGDGWFKIAEAGLISSNEWAVDALISAGGIQSVDIPSCIEDGDYLLRFELIALHSAYDEGGAQFYMECAQLRISGGSGSATPETSSIPGIYSPTDPGILISIYDDTGSPYPSSYTIPGPELFTCGDAPPAQNASESSAAPVLVPSASSSAVLVPSSSPSSSAVVVPSSSASASAVLSSALYSTSVFPESVSMEAPSCDSVTTVTVYA